MTGRKGRGFHMSDAEKTKTEIGLNSIFEVAHSVDYQAGQDNLTVDVDLGNGVKLPPIRLSCQDLEGGSPTLEGFNKAVVSRAVSHEMGDAEMVDYVNEVGQAQNNCRISKGM